MNRLYIQSHQIISAILDLIKPKKRQKSLVPTEDDTIVESFFIQEPLDDNNLEIDEVFEESFEGNNFEIDDMEIEE